MSTKCCDSFAIPNYRLKEFLSDKILSDDQHFANFLMFGPVPQELDYEVTSSQLIRDIL
jgi:hypothetical protein